MRERQAAAQRYMPDNGGKDQEEKKTKLDFEKEHTLEKLTAVLGDIDLEFLHIYARTLT